MPLPAAGPRRRAARTRGTPRRRARRLIAGVCLAVPLVILCEVGEAALLRQGVARPPLVALEELAELTAVWCMTACNVTLARLRLP